jgi:hypothetical protein
LKRPHFLGNWGRNKNSFRIETEPPLANYTKLSLFLKHIYVLFSSCILWQKLNNEIPFRFKQLSTRRAPEKKPLPLPAFHTRTISSPSLSGSRAAGAALVHQVCNLLQFLDDLRKLVFLRKLSYNILTYTISISRLLNANLVYFIKKNTCNFNTLTFTYYLSNRGVHHRYLRPLCSPVHPYHPYRRFLPGRTGRLPFLSGNTLS